MNFKRVMALLMTVSVLASGALLSSRMGAERSVKNVEIVVDYGEMNELSKQSEDSLDTWFKNLSSYGASSIALDEETFRSLRDMGLELEYGVRKLVKQDVEWREGMPAKAIEYIENSAKDYDFIVKTNDSVAIAQIDAGLSRGLEPAMYQKFSETGKETLYVINGTIDDMTYLSGNLVTDADEKILERPIDEYSSKIELLGLGFDAEKIKMIQASGLEVSPRPRNNTKAPWLLQKAFEKDLQTYNLKPSHIIFSGGSVLGYENENVMPLDTLIQMMTRNHIAVALIEAGNQRGNTEQDGIQYLAENSNYNVVRVFPVVKYIQKRFAFYNYTGPEEIENTIYRAATERNIRSVYFRPFMKNEKVYITDPAEYEKMFKSLNNRLAEHGLSLGKTSGFVFNGPNLILKWLSGFGVIVLAAWMLKYLFDLKEKIIYTLVGLGIAGVGGILFVAPNLSTSLLGLGAAIVYPGIAIVYFVEEMRKAYTDTTVVTFKTQMLQAIKTLLVGAVISTIGGLSVGAMLSHSSYLIEIDYFRGVKLSLAAPFLIFTLYYLVVFGFKRSAKEVKEGKHFYMDMGKLLDLNIKIGYLIILGLAAVIGYVYIARSGHETNLQPSDMEMIFRNILEYKFLARPRTKEFLMAFPMVMATIVFARGKVRELLFPAGLIAVIGFSSIANTFSHLRTPIYLSVARTAYSIGLSVITGAIAVVIASLLVKLIHTYLRSSSNE